MSHEAGNALLARLRHRLPANFSLWHCAAEDWTAALSPGELACITNAVDSRRREFSTGRWLARRGLEALGWPGEEIPCGPAREPLWPTGIAGSITHSLALCALAIARSRDCVSLGLDLELSAAPKPELAALIVSPTEPHAYREPVTLRLVFSAKEAVYKCLYPLTATFLDFQDIDLAIDPRSRTFTAVTRHPQVPRELLAGGIGLFESEAEGAVSLFSIVPGGSGARP